MIDIPKDALSHYVNFFGIPAHLVGRMLPLLSIKQLKRNEVLIHPGDICTTGYMVISGGLILSHVNQDNNEEKVVNFFLPSLQPFCTVWDSYFSGDKTRCRLFAFKDTRIGYGNKSDIENIIKADAEVLNYYLKKLNETLVFENNLRMKLITFTPEQFYNYLVVEHPQVIREVPNKYIAQFMGISREWLSKIKSLKDNR